MLNKSFIMGRFVADPELRSTGSGRTVCSFTLAVERDGAANEDGAHTADFIDCVAWGETAKIICAFFRKGRMAIAEGRAQTRTWKDRHEQSRKTTEIVIDKIYFGDRKRDETRPSPAGDAAAFGQTEEADEYGLPY